jgi:hypothetical protein
MAPMYPRPIDREMPFEARPEIALHPISPMRRPEQQPVLQPLVNASAFILCCGIVAWPAGKAIAAVASWLN